MAAAKKTAFDILMNRTNRQKDELNKKETKKDGNKNGATSAADDSSADVIILDQSIVVDVDETSKSASCKFEEKKCAFDASFLQHTHQYSSNFCCLETFVKNTFNQSNSTFSQMKMQFFCKI
jgi:hypothetical protein